MALFKGYWMAAAYCPGVVNNDMTVQDFVTKVGGTAGTSGTGGRSGKHLDGAAAINDLHNTNGTPKTNGTALQTYFSNRILGFPRATLEGWWPGSGWWPDYSTNIAAMGTTLDTTKLDQIAKAVPDGTLLVTDIEYSSQCPAWDGTGNQLAWAQDDASERRAILQIGQEGAAFAYLKAMLSALGKPNVKVFKYVSYPFTQTVPSGWRYNRDVKGAADYPPVSIPYPLGGYAALCDRIDKAFAWAVNQGAYSSAVCDGLLVDNYLPYNDAETLAGFGAGWSARAVLAAKMARDARLISRLKVPCYALFMGEKAAGGPMDDGAGNVRLVTAEQFQAWIDYAAAGYDGAVWYAQTFFKTPADVTTQDWTAPAWDTAIEPYGPANFFTTAQSIATR